MTHDPAPFASVSSPVLEMIGVTKSFDGRSALNDACFDLLPGEVHALLGENGAGKSTLMTIACGIYRADAGVLRIDGRETSLTGPKAAIRAGIGMVHQHFRLVASFTALENIRLTVPHLTTSGLRDLCARTGLAVDPQARVGTLSIAEQQRVEILKTLAGGARILLLDEPTAVLTDDEAGALLTLLRSLARKRIGIVLVTHKLHHVVAFADRITVMRAGRTVARNLVVGGLDQAAVACLVIGETAAAETATIMRRPSLEWCRLRIRDLAGPKFGPLSLEVCAREILGVAGVGGGGQSQLVDVLAGISPALVGTIELDGRDMTRQSPRRRRDGGLRLVPADRYGRAFVGDLGIAHNMALTSLRRGRYGSALAARRSLMDDDAERAIAAFEVKGGGPRTKLRLLSGGNAQKLLIARELDGEPGIVICHSPTRGLDAGACRAVDRALRRAREASAAILLISEDLDEVLALSDRVVVLLEGRIAASFAGAPNGFDRIAIGAAMVGHHA